MEIRDAQNLWNMYSRGIIGPYKDFMIAHNTISVLHQGKKPLKFKELFPDPDKWWSMGQEPIKPDFNTRMAKDMLAGRGADTPDWVLRAIQGDKDAS